MPQTLDSLRISVPETVYAQLEQPANLDLQLALDGLSRLFNVRHSESHPSYASQAWTAISDAMIEDPSGALRFPKSGQNLKLPGAYSALYRSIHGYGKLVTLVPGT